MKKLRIYFVAFAILLILPVGYLVLRTYDSLDKETFFVYRRAAEKAVQLTGQEIEKLLIKEEQRSYAEYRYAHVANQRILKLSGINVTLSPLADYPVKSNIAGLVGYFQIDPDGSFNTPLLPKGQLAETYPVERREERVALKNKLQTLAAKATDLFGQASMSVEPLVKNEADQDASNLISKLDTIVNRRFEKDYSNTPTRRAFSALSSDEKRSYDSKKSSNKRHRQLAPEAQAMIFDAELKENYSTDKFETEQSGSSNKKALAKTPQVTRSFELHLKGKIKRGDVQPPPPFAKKERRTMAADVDPFRVHFVDDQWLIFYRRVWWSERRYTQGFIVAANTFLKHHIKNALQKNTLSEGMDYIVLFNGKPIEQSASPTERPHLLYSSLLPYPLRNFGIAFALKKLPKHPGAELIDLFAAILSAILLFGLTSIYRLASKQLELSQKKTDFVSAVSHELKTPLTSIRMYGEMLMEGWVENEEKRNLYYAHIHDESERLTRLIQNVLQLAQLERNEWQVNLRPIDLSEMVAGIVSRLTSQAQRAGFTIEFKKPEGALIVEADSDALTQILINLVDNAIKFSGGGETKRIEISTTQQGNQCLLTVRDFGPGIPENKLKQIFDKFYRIENEMTRSTKGTGIGLALVKMLAQSMRADVAVKNCQPGVEFTLRFSISK